jgi:hypothetical protein
VADYRNQIGGALMSDCVLDKLKELGLINSVKNYLDFAYFGERTYESLEGEERAAIDCMVEEGELVLTESNFKN